MIVRHCSFHRCYRAVLPLLGVQFPFSAANSRAIAVHRLELHEMDGAMRGLLRPKLWWIRGRIGEVPAPASRFESFTLPLFAPAVLNGNPALRGRRLMPQWAAHHE